MRSAFSFIKYFYKALDIEEQTRIMYDLCLKFVFMERISKLQVHKLNNLKLEFVSFKTTKKISDTKVIVFFSRFMLCINLDINLKYYSN